MGDNITDTRTTAMDTEIVPPVVFDVNTTLTSTWYRTLFASSQTNTRTRPLTPPPYLCFGNTPSPSSVRCVVLHQHRQKLGRHLFGCGHVRCGRRDVPRAFLSSQAQLPTLQGATSF